MNSCRCIQNPERLEIDWPLTILSLAVRLSFLVSGVQSTVSNLWDILIIFGMLTWFGLRINALENGSDWISFLFYCKCFYSRIIRYNIKINPFRKMCMWLTVRQSAEKTSIEKQSVMAMRWETVPTIFE